MNKLGFYMETSNDNCGLWEAISRVQPPVILVHRNTLNRLLLQQIRKFRAPNAFVIGRVFLDLAEQERALNEGDPEANGRRLADDIITFDFGLARERGPNDRLLIDAWMSLNEAIPGPASTPFAQDRQVIEARLERYDRFQAAFGARLREAGLEAVAFNFAAGNFTRPEHYLEYFPQTLASYTYLGFHEYGWPTLFPSDHSSTGAGLYRTCMEGIRERFGDQHKVIITELGMTREFRHPFNEPRHPADEHLGDLGWLNHTETIAEEEYWRSLAWYNEQMVADDYVVGACLFEVGHSGKFFSHRHLCQDNEGRPLRIIDRIAALNGGQAPLMATATHPASARITVRGRVTLAGRPVEGATAVLTGARATLARLRRATAADPEGSNYAITTTTDAQGNYRLRGLPAGEYTLTAQAPGARIFTTAFSAASSIRIDVALTAAPPLILSTQTAGLRHIDCGINIDPANPAGNPSGAAVRELGATWVRLVFKNRPGQPLSDSFAEYDRVVNDMRQAGVQVLMILNNESCPGKPPREALDDAGRWREYIAQFAPRCGEVAAHYRDSVAAYQIWNEPDHPGNPPGYDPTVRADLYGEMLRSAFHAVKAFTSSLVVTAGMAFGDPNWVRRAMTATGNQLFADVLAVHPYGRRPKHQWPNQDWGGLPGPEMIEFLQNYRTQVGKPIWVTEFGTEDQHTRVPGSNGATMLARDLFPGVTFESVGNQLRGVVTKFFWFCWSDGMVDGFGLLNGNGQRKIAFDSFCSYALRPFGG